MRMITPRGRRVRGTVGSPRWPPAGRSGRGEYRIKAGHLKTTIRNGTAATGAINNTAHRRVKNKESGGKKAPPRSDRSSRALTFSQRLCHQRLIFKLQGRSPERNNYKEGGWRDAPLLPRPLILKESQTSVYSSHCSSHPPYPEQ